MKNQFLWIMFLSIALPVWAQETGPEWRHLSSADGDLQMVFNGRDQTSAALLDANLDGITEFVITERSSAPAVVLYLRTSSGWVPHLVDSTSVPIAAGTDAGDIDGDGDPDIFAGGARVPDVWWWENPYPELDPQRPWVRRVIKNFGGRKNHDQIMGDFDGDGRAELAFWNQGSRGLFVAEIPKNPRGAEPWACEKIYRYSVDSEMEQRGRYPKFKGVNEHEGLAKADIDGDGVLDIIGGGRWFKYDPDFGYIENIIDAGFTFTRAEAGQLIEGGRPEVVLAPGDGWAPMMMYQWQEGTWVGRVLIEEVDCAHSLRVIDFNRDGHMDIWFAEMRLDDGNPDARNEILIGDGTGSFESLVVSRGFGVHESEIVDLDGDGDYDVLGKPYRWDSPRLDIWLYQGP